MRENLIKNEFIEFWLDKGILFSRFHDAVEVDVEKMEIVVKMRGDISRKEKQFWLYDISNVKNITKEARDYADANGQEYLYAVAVLVNSHITKFIFNTYTKLKKPVMPFYVFTNKAKALEWLLELKGQKK